MTDSLKGPFTRPEIEAATQEAIADLRAKLAAETERANRAELSVTEWRTKAELRRVDADRLRARVAALEGALTPCGDTKAAYHGELKFSIPLNVEDEDGEPQEINHQVYVPWDTTKEIMAAIRKHAALSAPPAPAVQTEENMRRLGHAVMDALAIQTTDPKSPLYEWSPAECPSEVIGDLVDMVETARGAVAVSQVFVDLASVPVDLKDTIRRMGAIEWGATEAKSAEEHAAATLSSVTKTAEHFAQTGNQQMHGCYLQGSEVVICHTGTSPNSPNNARLIVGLWNWLLSEIERLDRAADGDEREG